MLANIRPLIEAATSTGPGPQLKQQQSLCVFISVKKTFQRRWKFQFHFNSRIQNVFINLMKKCE